MGEIPFYESTYYDNLAGCPNVIFLTLEDPEDLISGPSAGGWPVEFQGAWVD